jgi:hypothetical protein
MIEQVLSRNTGAAVEENERRQSVNGYSRERNGFRLYRTVVSRYRHEIEEMKSKV